MNKIKTNSPMIGGVLAFFVATSCCWLPSLAIAFGGASGIVAISNGIEQLSGPLMGLGSFFLVFGIYQVYSKKEKPKVILESVICCPNCGYRKAEIMPMNACQYFYECDNCQTVLKPNEGDCCVFCSFGTVKCPPIQQGENCCAD